MNKSSSGISMALMRKKLHSKGMKPMAKRSLVKAMNARKWKKENGGLVEKMEGGGVTGWGTNVTQGQVGGAAGIAGLVGGGMSTMSQMGEQPNIALGIAGGAASGAAAGMALGPIGAGVGAVVGGGLAAVKGVMQKNKFEDQMAALEKQQLANVQAGQVASNQGGIGNIPTFSKGGVISNAIPTVEVEKDEILDNGSLAKVKGKKHSQGGEQIALEPGTRVFSAKLGYADEADMIRKQIEKYEQILNS